jgi:hypothetical protein
MGTRSSSCLGSIGARSGGRLSAAGFFGGHGGEVRRQVACFVGLHLQGEKTEERESKIHLAVGSINGRSNGKELRRMPANDVNRFLDATAFGDDVFYDDQAFAGSDFESPSEDEFPFFFLDENEPAPELSGNFLAEHESAHGWGDDSGGTEVAEFVGERVAEFFDDWHLLEGESALEILAAVEAAAENEMAFKQRAGIAEHLEDFIAGHAAHGS